MLNAHIFTLNWWIDFIESEIAIKLFFRNRYLFLCCFLGHKLINNKNRNASTIFNFHWIFFLCIEQISWLKCSLFDLIIYSVLCSLSIASLKHYFEVKSIIIWYIHIDSCHVSSQVLLNVKVGKKNFMLFMYVGMELNEKKKQNKNEQPVGVHCFCVAST